MRIAVLIVPGIGRNMFSVKTATRKGIVSIFDVNKPRLKAGDITVPLRGENDALYSFKLNLSADGYVGKELAMNAVTNAQVWHQRLGHLDTRSLGLMNRNNGNGVAFDGSIADCDVCAVGKSHQLAHPKKVNHAANNAPFQLVYGDLMGPSNRRLMVDTSLSATSPTRSHGGSQSTFSAAKIKPLPRFSCSSLQP